jgi:hypothetical protein
MNSFAPVRFWHFRPTSTPCFNAPYVLSISAFFFWRLLDQSVRLIILIISRSDFYMIEASLWATHSEHFCVSFVSPLPTHSSISYQISFVNFVRVSPIKTLFLIYKSKVSMSESFERVVLAKAVGSTSSRSRFLPISLSMGASFGFSPVLGVQSAEVESRAPCSV